MTELDRWLARSDRPLAVVTGRAREDMRPQLSMPVQVVDTMRVRSHEMLLVRRAEDGPPR